MSESAKTEETLVNSELVLTPASTLPGDAAAGIHKLGGGIFVCVCTISRSCFLRAFPVLVGLLAFILLAFQMQVASGKFYFKGLLALCLG